MEQHPEQEIDNQQESIDFALGNFLIIGKICSYLWSEMDLRSLRLLDRDFHREATIKLKRVQSQPIDLRSETSLEKFLELMKTRINPEDPNVYPFSAFKLNFQNSPEVLGRFAAEAGPHVQHLDLYPHEIYSFWNNNELSHVTVTMLLSQMPNLARIQLNATFPTYIPNRDIAGLPKFFHKLRFIDIDLWSTQSPIPPDSVNLLVVIANRSPLLAEVQQLSIEPMIPENDILQAVQALSTPNILQNIPLIVNGRFIVRSQILPRIQKLLNFNLRIRKLYAQVHLESGIEAINNNTITTFSPWLGKLSSCLESLNIVIYAMFFRQNIRLSIPPLAALTNFHIELVACYRKTNFMIPLSQVQFPALRTLRLSICSHWSSAVKFQGTSLPTVQELHVEDYCGYQHRLESYPWHRVLPNLTTIGVHVNSRWFGKHNLGYLFRSFPKIINLELYIFPKRRLNVWNELTGRALRPFSTDALINGGSWEYKKEAEDPVDGVYRFPSLGNFRALQTFKCRPGNRSNLDAILYMTRIGRLGPLKKINLITRNQEIKMKDEDKTAYSELLTRFHADVDLRLE